MERELERRTSSYAKASAAAFGYGAQDGGTSRMSGIAPQAVTGDEKYGLPAELAGVRLS